MREAIAVTLPSQKRRRCRRAGLDQLGSVIFDVADRLADLPSA
jgi:hypothetical protein